MPTLLTTSKMSPALRARVEASVRGRKTSTGRPRPGRLRAASRVVLVLAILGTVTAVAAAERQLRRDRETARAALLEAARAERASLTEDDLKSVERASGWLSRLATTDEPDHVAADVRSPNGLQTLLARSAVYVRGPLGSFKSAAGIAEAASESSKDALLSCLFEPPASRAEKVVLAKVKEAYPGTWQLDQLTANVQNFGVAKVGLPLLSPHWTDSVTADTDVHEIEALQTRLKKAPLARARQALKAEVLIAVMDDTDSGTGPTELDGARAHDVRFAMVDLRSSSVIVRLKRHVDPSWISLPLRPQHASKLDSCVLAMDIREAIARR
jgi:hypothetical protein